MAEYQRRITRGQLVIVNAEGAPWNSPLWNIDKRRAYAEERLRNGNWLVTVNGEYIEIPKRHLELP
jgi:hypothetical protein